MTNKKILIDVIDYAKRIYSDFEITHDIEHIERVVSFAELLARREKANLDIVKISAWLHDIGYENMSKREMVESDHAIISAKKARKFLKGRIEDSIIDMIYECIFLHRTDRINNNSSIEAKCLHDADKLDCVGIRGLLRLFVWDLTIEPRTLNISGYLKHLRGTIERKENSLLTNTAKEIAKNLNKNAYKLINDYENEISSMSHSIINP